MQEYNYFFARLAEISNQKRIDLIAYFGNAKEAYEKSEKEIIASGIFNLSDVKKLTDAKKERPLSDYEAFEKIGIGLITFFDLEYPPNLRFIFDAPFALFVKGEIPKDLSHAVAIVGARKCSAYGRVAAEDIAKELAKNDAVIISGMARGIDGISHSGALLKSAKTVAVLGCGVDICYPQENLSLYNNISENGAVISEYPPGTPPLPTNFPLRNRIISGLSRAVIVIEAKEKSGSLITAEFALDQGREVYALPGRINDIGSAGCNNLIKEGAGIINSINGLIEDLYKLEILGEAHLTKKKKKDNLRLTKDEKAVLKVIDYSPISIDEIITKTKLSIFGVIENTELLEEKGLIKQEGKNSFVKNRL